MDSFAIPKTRVLLAAPYCARGGGIGCMMTYLAQDGAEYAPEFDFTRLETRGNGAAMWSIFPILSALFEITRARRKSAILHVNMAERGSVWRKGILLMAARWLGMKSLLHLHAAEIIEVYHQYGPWRRRRLRQVFKAASVVVVLDVHWRDFVWHELGIDPARIEILPNGVPDPGNPNLYRSHLVTELLFVGNLLPRKGLADLLAALAQPRFRTRSWRLTVIGGGSAAALYAEADRLGIGTHIHFLGWQPRALITSALRHADIFVLPSHAEGLPLVVLEALSLAVPVVCTGVGALPSWLTHRKNALLVPINDPPGLAAAIDEVMRTPPLAARLGAAGRELYLESFTLPRFVHGLTGIYRRHCLPPPPRAPLAPAIPELTAG